MSEGKFPDFIIVGAMKCGTTVLWHNMDNHPDINMGKNWEDPKKTSTEIRFWNNGGPYHTWKTKGVDWYKTLFSGKCCGEKSANYIESSVAMSRIAEHIPSCKIVLCVRNPTDRAYSEYQMQLHTAPKKNKKGFEVAFKGNTGYQKRGKYIEMIESNVLSRFPGEQLYVCVQERMATDTDNELNRLYQYLGLSEFHQEVKSVHSKKRDVFIDEYKVWHTEYAALTPQFRKEVDKFYAPFNKRLFDLMGHEINEWKKV